MSDGRIVCRYSCGAASAVATKMTLTQYPDAEVVITYSDPGSEHPDNARFMRDCSEWFGREIITLRNEAYIDTWDVFERERYLVGQNGAKCTGLLKRAPTYDFQQPGDILVFGYTKEETTRAERFRRTNFEQPLLTPLIDAGLSKADCLAALRAAGIEIPAMYRLGYRNNNCLGCVKGGMGYWNKIRRDFPDVFERMASIQRKLGPGSYFWRERDSGDRISLDALDPNRGRYEAEPDIECSLMCHAAIQDGSTAPTKGESHV